MIIRRERPADYAGSRAIQAEAFAEGEDEAIEARFVDELRACDLVGGTHD